MKTKSDLLKIVRLEPLASREELIALCQQTTRLTLDRDAVQLARDEKIATVHDQYTPAMESMAAEIERNVTRIENWARQHREAEFGKKQSRMIAGCVLEFRKGTGKVEAATTDKAAVNAILSLPDDHNAEIEELIRMKTELDKEAVKRIAKTKEGAEFLAKLGLKVVVEEEFTFTPSREDLTETGITGGKETVAA